MQGWDHRIKAKVNVSAMHCKIDYLCRFYIYQQLISAHCAVHDRFGGVFAANISQICKDNLFFRPFPQNGNNLGSDISQGETFIWPQTGLAHCEIDTSNLTFI